MYSPVCSHCLCFQCEGFVSNTGRRDSRVFLCSKGRLGRKSTRFWKLHCVTKIATIQTPYPKLMIMVSYCWKMNVLPNKIKGNSVSSTLFIKLTIKVVEFFWATLYCYLMSRNSKLYRTVIYLTRSTDTSWAIMMIQCTVLSGPNLLY